MPRLTRESKALLAFTLAVAALLSGGGDPLTSIGVPAYLRPVGGWTIGLVDGVSTLMPLAFGIAALLLARSAGRAAEPIDGWRHLAVAGFWLGAIVTLLALLGLVGQGFEPAWRFAG